MAGRGPAPKDPAKRRNTSQTPVRGEWRATPGVGWQHGDLPPAPDGLMPASQSAWVVWFGAWFASHWSPDDLPSIRQMIRLYDQVERGEFQRAGELRLWLDTLGVSPKGQQDRRWAPPKVEEPAQAGAPSEGESRYGHLRAVGTG